MKFLLNQADLFAHFLLSRNEKHKNQKKGPSASNKKRTYLNEKDEEQDLLEFDIFKFFPLVFNKTQNINFFDVCRLIINF